MFLYLHQGKVWGNPLTTYDCAYEKLTDEETKKLPSTFFFNHRQHSLDSSGNPELLQVHFLETEIGNRLHLANCNAMDLRFLAHEENVRTALMGHHTRIGANSLLRTISHENLVKIVTLALTK
jgi:hypothetical protein